MRLTISSCLALLAAQVFVLTGLPALAAPVPAEALKGDGLALARAVAERPTNTARVGRMVFTLTAKSGQARQREALMLHADGEDAIRIAIHFKAPAALANTAFLSHDFRAGTDESWLFLPATERVRRIPSADRGDYFMGTDITYGDIKDDFKFGLEDWQFLRAGERMHEGRSLPVLQGKARTAELAREMGYASFEALIDPVTRFPVWALYRDAEGQDLKRVVVSEQKEIGGAWTAMRFRVEQLQSGHITDIHFEDMRAVASLPAKTFDAALLGAGPPKIG